MPIHNQKPVRYYIVKADDLAVVKSVPVARAASDPAAPPVAAPGAALDVDAASALPAGRGGADAALRPVRRLVRAATRRSGAERSR